MNRVDGAAGEQGDRRKELEDARFLTGPDIEMTDRPRVEGGEIGAHDVGDVDIVARREAIPVDSRAMSLTSAWQKIATTPASPWGL